MKKVNVIVTRIARKLGVVAAGEVPTGSDAEDILGYLQGVIDGLPLLRDGEWTDVVLMSAAAYSASDGDRIATNGLNPVITLPTTYTDEHGALRIQRDLSRVQVIGEGLYIWAASMGAWGKTDDLTLTDNFPWGPEDEAGLVALTVVSAAGEYGAQVDPIDIALGQSAIRDFSARFYREVPVRIDPAFLRMSDTGRCGWGRG